VQDGYPQLPQLPPQHPPPPKLGCDEIPCDEAPCIAKTENWRSAFACPQAGQGGAGSSSLTSSSKCSSQPMHTYS
jgi:hypothetical protein